MILYHLKEIIVQKKLAKKTFKIAALASGITILAMLTVVPGGQAVVAEAGQELTSNIGEVYREVLKTTKGITDNLVHLVQNYNQI